MAGIIPVHRAGCAEEHQTGAVLLAEPLNLLDIADVPLRDLCRRLNGLHILPGVCPGDGGIVAVPFPVIGPCEMCFPQKIVPAEGFPPVVVSEHRQVVGQPGKDGLLGGDFPVNGICFQDHNLGFLVLQRPDKQLQGVVQGLGTGPTHIGRVPLIPPQVHGGDGGVGLAVP